MKSQQRAQLQKLRTIHQKRLDILEQQAASFGLYAPPHILTEITTIQTKIKSIDIQLVFETVKIQHIYLLCYDHFRPVYDRLRRGTSPEMLMQWLVQYAEETEQVEELYNLITVLT